jgi:hypothetical protein
MAVQPLVTTTTMQRSDLTLIVSTTTLLEAAGQFLLGTFLLVGDFSEVTNGSATATWSNRLVKSNAHV